VGANGEAGAETVVASAGPERSSGFPHMVLDAQGRLVVAWTDVSGSERVVRVGSIPAKALARPAQQ
jgi:hypothetical protein